MARISSEEIGGLYRIAVLGNFNVFSSTVATGMGNVCRHSWKKLQLGIREFDDRVVGDHALHHGCVHPHLAHNALKSVLGEGVDLESHGPSKLDAADIRLIGFCVNPTSWSGLEQL